MSNLQLNGSKQCVATLVSFKNEKGEPFVILGRGDPRYHDTTGKALQGHKLSVGFLQLIGGHAEYDREKTKNYWPDNYPALANWPSTLGQSNELQPLSKRIAVSGMRELAEEAHISPESFDRNPALKDLMNKARLHYSFRLSSKTEKGDRMTMHYLHLDLGTLTTEQIHAVQKTVHPGDDMIQTIIVPARAIQKNDRRLLAVQLTDGYVATKTDFAGFPELEQWNENMDNQLKTATGKERDNVIKAKHAFSELHKLRGMEGIDTNDLETTEPIALLDGGIQLKHNSRAVWSKLVDWNINPILTKSPSVFKASRLQPADVTIHL